MKKALLITFYDEVEVVCSTVKRVGPYFDFIGLVQSTDEGFDAGVQRAVEKTLVDHWMKTFPNLGSMSNQWELPALSLTRNYSALFRMLDGHAIDYAVAITGDTLLLHTFGLQYLLDGMVDAPQNKVGCSRAVGQNFHAAELTAADLAQGREGGRMQTDDVADFMPQLFIVHKDVFDNYSQIHLTNRWCSEQCLGDVLMRRYGAAWVSHQLIFSRTAYGFQDGVIYHAKKG